jgi:histidyl-tRNA synthetase
MDKIQVVKGTHDILPFPYGKSGDVVGHWQRVEAIARDIMARAAFQEIRTPIFEHTELFKRGIGEATDVVGKEMYTFDDKGNPPRSMTLRPEGTAGAVRSYVEAKLDKDQLLQRWWYMGPMFRYERPQAGRQRQFHQLGLELIATADVRADVEAIAIAVDILKAVGLGDLVLELNSLGTKADRVQYRDRLVDYLTPYKDDLDPDSQDRLTRNPLRILDSKVTKTQEIIASAPLLGESLSAESQARFVQVQVLLDDLGIAYQLNPKLVRGLDYYSHTAFEFQSVKYGAVGGGGRYDGLVAELGGKATPAVGWAIGMERLMGLLVEEMGLLPLRVPTDFYVISRGELAERQGLAIAQQVRQAGFKVELDLSGSRIEKQLERAIKSGAAAGLIVGESEAEHRTVQVKWLATKEQMAVAQDALADELAGWRGKLAAARL